MVTVKALISIGFILEEFTTLPVRIEMNCFCEYEIRLFKNEYGQEDERITLTVNSFRSLDKQLKELLTIKNNDQN
jgi:hypothetical protein